MKLKTKVKLFPWVQEVQDKLYESFSFGKERTWSEAINFLIESSHSELSSIIPEDDCERAHSLLKVLKDYLVHFHLCSAVSSEQEEVRCSVLKFAACIGDLFLFLSQGDPKSEYIKNFIKEFSIFTQGDNVKMMEILIHCGMLRKRHANVCCPLLKYVLSKINPAELTEPRECIMFIMLLRLWKVFASSNNVKVLTFTLASRITFTKDFFQYLSSACPNEPLTISSKVTSKKLAKFFLYKKKLSTFFKTIKKVLCNTVGSAVPSVCSDDSIVAAMNGTKRLDMDFETLQSDVTCTLETLNDHDDLANAYFISTNSLSSHDAACSAPKAQTKKKENTLDRESETVQEPDEIMIVEEKIKEVATTSAADVQNKKKRKADDVSVTSDIKKKKKQHKSKNVNVEDSDCIELDSEIQTMDDDSSHVVVHKVVQKESLNVKNSAKKLNNKSKHTASEHADLSSSEQDHDLAPVKKNSSISHIHHDMVDVPDAISRKSKVRKNAEKREDLEEDCDIAMHDEDSSDVVVHKVVRRESFSTENSAKKLNKKRKHSADDHADLPTSSEQDHDIASVEKNSPLSHIHLDKVDSSEAISRKPKVRKNVEKREVLQEDCNIVVHDEDSSDIVVHEVVQKESLSVKNSAKKLNKKSKHTASEHADLSTSSEQDRDMASVENSSSSSDILTHNEIPKAVHQKSKVRKDEGERETLEEGHNTVQSTAFETNEALKSYTKKKKKCKSKDATTGDVINEDSNVEVEKQIDDKVAKHEVDGSPDLKNRKCKAKDLKHSPRLTPCDDNVITKETSSENASTFPSGTKCTASKRPNKVEVTPGTVDADANVLLATKNTDKLKKNISLTDENRDFDIKVLQESLKSEKEFGEDTSLLHICESTASGENLDQHSGKCVKDKIRDNNCLPTTPCIIDENVQSTQMSDDSKQDACLERAFEEPKTFADVFDPETSLCGKQISIVQAEVLSGNSDSDSGSSVPVLNQEDEHVSSESSSGNVSDDENYAPHNSRSPEVSGSEDEMESIEGGCTKDTSSPMVGGCSDNREPELGTPTCGDNSDYPVDDVENRCSEFCVQTSSSPNFKEENTAYSDDVDCSSALNAADAKYISKAKLVSDDEDCSSDVDDRVGWNKCSSSSERKCLDHLPSIDTEDQGDPKRVCSKNDCIDTPLPKDENCPETGDNTDCSAQNKDELDDANQLGDMCKDGTQLDHPKQFLETANIEDVSTQNDDESNDVNQSIVASKDKAKLETESITDFFTETNDELNDVNKFKAASKDKELDCSTANDNVLAQVQLDIKSESQPVEESCDNELVTVDMPVAEGSMDGRVSKSSTKTESCGSSLPGAVHKVDEACRDVKPSLLVVDNMKFSPTSDTCSPHSDDVKDEDSSDSYKASTKKQIVKTEEGNSEVSSDNKDSVAGRVSSLPSVIGRNLDSTMPMSPRRCSSRIQSKKVLQEDSNHSDSPKLSVTRHPKRIISRANSKDSENSMNVRSKKSSESASSTCSSMSLISGIGNEETLRKPNAEYSDSEFHTPDTSDDETSDEGEHSSVTSKTSVKRTLRRKSSRKVESPIQPLSAAKFYCKSPQDSKLSPNHSLTVQISSNDIKSCRRMFSVDKLLEKKQDEHASHVAETEGITKEDTNSSNSESAIKKKKPRKNVPQCLKDSPVKKATPPSRRGYNLRLRRKEKVREDFVKH